MADGTVFCSMERLYDWEAAAQRQASRRDDSLLRRAGSSAF